MIGDRYTPERVRKEWPPYPDNTVIELPARRHRAEYRRLKADRLVIDILLMASIVAVLAALSFYMTHL